MKKQLSIKSAGKSIWKNRQMYILLFPFMLFFFLFTVYPVIASLFVSFTEYNVLEAPRFVGLNNYKRLFLEDTVFKKALGNTVVFAVVTGPVGYIISFFISWVINELDRYSKAVLTFVFYIPSISGTVYTVWALIFDSDIYGYANSFLIKTGFIRDPIDWLTNEKYILAIIIIVQLWMSMGTGFLAMRAGFATAEHQYYEAGAIDGIKNRWQELWYITLPSMRPQLMFGAVMQISAAFSVGAVGDALVGFPSVDYATHTVINHLTDYGTVRFELGYACAIATLLFFMTVGTNKLVNLLLSKVGR